MPFSVFFNCSGELVSSYTGFKMKCAPDLRQVIKAQLSEDK